jgi:hypothetical protein
MLLDPKETHPQFQAQLGAMVRADGQPLTIAFDFEEENDKGSGSEGFVKTMLACVRCGCDDVWQTLNAPDDVWLYCSRCGAQFQVRVVWADDGHPKSYPGAMIAALQNAARIVAMHPKGTVGGVGNPDQYRRADERRERLARSKKRNRVGLKKA